MKIANLKKQSGSAIVVAVFVILVISLLGASLVSLQRDSAEGAGYEVYAARAYLSAYSASETALVQLFPLNASTESSCAAVTTPTLPGDNAGFHGCTVNVTCTSTPASAGFATRYRVISTATCENSQINTRRQITVEASNL
ncbi:hypothetical protein [Psychromonas aquimarina]|uniref:hypothetical protein n=1 Tax=Psychromonas aquimarina TaxID=444919 RepID=UPI0003F642A2|nr:hypothetical protein [Psychromonas aquimarina]